MNYNKAKCALKNDGKRIALAPAHALSKYFLDNVR